MPGKNNNFADYDINTMMNRVCLFFFSLFIVCPQACLFGGSEHSQTRAGETVRPPLLPLNQLIKAVLFLIEKLIASHIKYTVFDSKRSRSLYWHY